MERKSFDKQCDTFLMEDCSGKPINNAAADPYFLIDSILFISKNVSHSNIFFSGSPGTPSSSPPASLSSVAQPRNGGNGGKLPDENSNMAAQVDRHDSISPASMDSSIQEDERSSKSKAKIISHKSDQFFAQKFRENDFRVSPNLPLLLDNL